MNERSPAMDRICKAAVEHFANRGYDGASLSEIAAMVGIRKASLYSHFSGKDALFIAVFSDALEVETEVIKNCFETETMQSVPGSRYCSEIASRYNASPYLRFLLRAGYFPPDSIKDSIDGGYVKYLTSIFDAFVSRLRKLGAQGAALPEGEVNIYGQAYLGIVDSLHVSLVYTEGEGVSVRLQSMLRILSDSLQLSGVLKAGGE